jgi:transcriptional regulator with XRE-family HTH domain
MRVMRGSDLLRSELDAKGIRAAEAARQLGVSKPTIGDWLSGASRPTAARALLVATWSEGRVPVESWETDEEREARAALATEGGAARGGTTA